MVHVGKESLALIMFAATHWYYEETGADGNVNRSPSLQLWGSNPGPQEPQSTHLTQPCHPAQLTVAFVNDNVIQMFPMILTLSAGSETFIKVEEFFIGIFPYGRF